MAKVYAVEPPIYRMGYVNPHKKIIPKYQVSCDNCKLGGQVCALKERAIETWNDMMRRADKLEDRKKVILRSMDNSDLLKRALDQFND